MHVRDPQEEMARYAHNRISAPSICGTTDLEDGTFTSDDQQNNLFVWKADCEEHPDFTLILTITDTTENWDKTLEACSNVQAEKSTVNEEEGTTTKYFAVLGDSGIDYIAFYRPKDVQAMPEISNIDKKNKGGFVKLAGTQKPTCGLVPDYRDECSASNPSWDNVLYHLE